MLSQPNLQTPSLISTASPEEPLLVRYSEKKHLFPGFEMVLPYVKV